MEKPGALPYQPPVSDATIYPLYSELQAVLGNPNFMRHGGVLGFASHHTYVFTDLNNVTALPVLLKGADRLVYFITRCLGLSVVVKPVVRDDYDFDKYLLPTFSHFKAYNHEMEEQGEEMMMKYLKSSHTVTSTSPGVRHSVTGVQQVPQ